MSRFMIFILVISVFNTHAQTLNSVLAIVERNNPVLKSAQQEVELINISSRTGLTPSNPYVEYEYLKGSPAAAGNQEDFSVIQSFDFPTAYTKRAQLARQQTKHAELTYRLKRQNVLQETRLTCIELIYLHKQRSLLQQRLLGTEKLARDYQTLLQKGDGNILDVSKAELQLLEIKRKYAACRIRISELNAALRRLSADVILQYNDSVYPDFPLLVDSTALMAAYQEADPRQKMHEQELQLRVKELELNKALRLPGFEAGYHYQGILGQTYSGIHTGITLPLWESRNKVRAARLQLALTDTENKNYQSALQNKAGSLYSRASALQKVMSDYRSVFQQLNDEELLGKALRLGQISVIEYFMELSYYHTARENYLLAEKEFYETVSELYIYLL